VKCQETAPGVEVGDSTQAGWHAALEPPQKC
jgi:hypothetical protein